MHRRPPKRGKHYKQKTASCTHYIVTHTPIKKTFLANAPQCALNLDDVIFRLVVTISGNWLSANRCGRPAIFAMALHDRIASSGPSSGKCFLNAILSVCRGSVTVYSFGLADFSLPEAPFGKPAFLEAAFFLLEGAGFFLTAFFFGDFLGAAFFLATVCTPLPGCRRDFRLGRTQHRSASRLLRKQNVCNT